MPHWMTSFDGLGASATGPVTDKLDLNELAELFGLTTVDDYVERGWEYVADSGHQAYEETIRDGGSETEAESAREKAEMAAQDEQYSTYHNALTSVVDNLFAEHGLKLEPTGKKTRYPFSYRVAPEKSWEDAANHIRETINGVGYFHFNTLKEFLDSGPYTARQAVLSHLHWIKRYPEVYGNGTARSMFERAFR